MRSRRSRPFATAGARPFRTVVGVDFGVRDRNASAEPYDAGLLEAMGLASFATLAARQA